MLDLLRRSSCARAPRLASAKQRAAPRAAARRSPAAPRRRPPRSRPLRVLDGQRAHRLDRDERSRRLESALERAPIRAITRMNPVRVQFTPTSRTTTRGAGHDRARARKNAAETGIAGTRSRRARARPRADHTRGRRPHSTPAWSSIRSVVIAARLGSTTVTPSAVEARRAARTTSPARSPSAAHIPVRAGARRGRRTAEAPVAGEDPRAHQLQRLGDPVDAAADRLVPVEVEDGARHLASQPEAAGSASRRCRRRSCRRSAARAGRPRTSSSSGAARTPRRASAGRRAWSSCRPRRGSCARAPAGRPSRRGARPGGRSTCGRRCQLADQAAAAER